MTTIAQYAADHNMQPYEIAAYLDLGRAYHDDDILTEESLAILSGDPDGFGVGFASVCISVERGRSNA